MTHINEHEISQYVDDTSLYLVDTERCLSQSLTALTWFYTIPGLTINIEKSKVICIGKIREFDCRYCRENDIEFLSLGIIFTLNDFENKTKYNIESKSKDIRNFS